MRGKVIAHCPGACGEWIQGAREGVPFLVDCPIDRQVTVFASYAENGKDRIRPQNKKKAYKALKMLTSARADTEGRIGVEYLTELPEGKGMASSTADIAALSAAVIRLQSGRDAEPEELLRLALQVEPSDSVMFPGITEIAHVDGRFCKILGDYVPARFLALDWGGEIDTVGFNARNDLPAHYRRSEREIAQALTLVRTGIQAQDLEKLAYGATISARCNQEINPKPHFESFLAWVKRAGGMGVITAHSGSLLAAVFSCDHDMTFLEMEAKERFKPEFMEIFQAQGGGVDIKWQE